LEHGQIYINRVGYKFGGTDECYPSLRWTCRCFCHNLPQRVA
jgi:hypothetical protein